jgi:hypothetical protein
MRCIVVGSIQSGCWCIPIEVSGGLSIDRVVPRRNTVGSRRPVRVFIMHFFVLRSHLVADDLQKVLSCRV